MPPNTTARASGAFLPTPLPSPTCRPRLWRETAGAERPVDAPALAAEALLAPAAMIDPSAQASHFAAALLTDPAAPIVPLAETACPLPQALAPGRAVLGWMLPDTPLHHLLPDPVQRPLAMTSGTLTREPRVIANAGAREKPSRFAEAFLMHGRRIARRADDSVESTSPDGRRVAAPVRGAGNGTAAARFRHRAAR